MKKIALSLLILFGSLSIYAKSVNIDPIVSSIILQDDYKEIKIENLPQAISSTIKKHYPDGIIEKVGVNEYSVYKIIIVIKDKKKMILCEQNGNEVF